MVDIVYMFGDVSCGEAWVQETWRMVVCVKVLRVVLCGHGFVSSGRNTQVTPPLSVPMEDIALLRIAS